MIPHMSFTHNLKVAS